MVVYLVKHHKESVYAADNEERPAHTRDRDKAFRFGTAELAEKCRNRMPISIAWEIVPVVFRNGRVVEDESC